MYFLVGSLYCFAYRFTIRTVSLGSLKYFHIVVRMTKKVVRRKRNLSCYWFFTGHSCSKEEYRCDNLQCVKRTQKCDGQSHCVDGSDERGCRCLNRQFSCLSGECLLPEKLRDGEKNCQDGEDEKEGQGKNIFELFSFTSNFYQTLWLRAELIYVSELPYSYLLTIR